MLAPHGVATIEVPHLVRLIEGLQFDTIYHEHYSYFSLHDARRASSSTHGLEVFDVEELPSHGGSLRVYVKRVAATSRTRSSRASRELLERERAAGYDRLEGYADFADRVAETKWQLLELLIGLRRDGKQVVGYGAPGKGNTLLNYCGIRTDLLDYTVDRNPYKHGQVPARHAHPDLSAGADRRDAARLHPDPAVEPDERRSPRSSRTSASGARSSSSRSRSPEVCRGLSDASAR